MSPAPVIRTFSRLLRLGLLGLTGLLLTGCLASGPAPLPVPELPDRFSASGEAAAAARWWSAFDDPVLATLIEQALQDNLGLRATWERLRQARASARKAGAELVPSLSGEAGAGSVRSRSAGQTGSSRDFSLGLSASYELDLWSRIRSLRDAALLDATASAAELQTAALSLSATVAGIWFQLQESYGQLDLLEAQIASNRQVLELIELRFRTGQTGISDVLQQRQLIEATRGEQLQVDARRRLLEQQLAILLGLPPDRQVAPRHTSLPALPPLPATGLPAELVTRRPDLRSARARVLAADRRLAAALAERFPQLSLAARLDTSGDQLRDLFDNWLASIAASLVTPLVDGSRRRAETERTRAVANEALQAWGQAVLDALGEVEGALAQEDRQRAYLESLDKQLELAGTVLDRVQDRYTKGAETYQRVLDALIARQKLERTRLAAQRTLLEHRIALYRALSGGWELTPAADRTGHRNG